MTTDTQSIGFYAMLILNSLRLKRQIDEANDQDGDQQNDPAEQSDDEVPIVAKKRASLRRGLAKFTLGG